MIRQLVVQSVEEMRLEAERLANALEGGEIIGLTGPLGVGKTEFARGVIESLVQDAEVSSPSYIIENIFDVKNKTFSSINHLDLYRLGELATFPEIDEYSLNKNCVTLIEWPERISSVRDLLSLELSIAFASPELATSQPDTRLLAYRALSTQGERLLAAITAADLAK